MTKVAVVAPRRGFRLKLAEYVDKLKSRRQTAAGAEIPDSTPMAPPVGWFKQPSMVDHIREMVRGEHLRMAAEKAGAETFEEADDFDIPDDIYPASAHEVGDLEPVSFLKERKSVSEREAEAAGSQNPPAAPAGDPQGEQPAPLGTVPVT